MQRQCESCGSSFEASRRTARYCGATCRKRASRSPKQPSASSVAAETAAAVVVSSDLVGAVRRELVAANKADSVLGCQALSIAERMTNPIETGASVAAMSRELRSVMALALQNAASDDPVDELQKKRDEKRASAG